MEIYGVVTSVGGLRRGWLLPGVLKDKEPCADTGRSALDGHVPAVRSQTQCCRAISRVGNSSVVDIHISELNRSRALSVHVGPGNVVADVLQVVGIRDVDHSDARVHIRDPDKLVFESIQLAVDGFGVLM